MLTTVMLDISIAVVGVIGGEDDGVYECLGPTDLDCGEC
jgi:hypothetical protein